MPTPLRAVVFDLDDTLYLERDYVRSGYRAVAERVARQQDRAREIESWMWQRFCRGKGSAMFDAVNERFDLHLTDEQIAGLVQLYRCHRPTLHSDVDMLKVLQSLRRHVKLGLLSDGFLPAQRYKLEALDLTDAFDAVLFTESMGRDCWKPSTAGFERLARQLESPHTACAYVADNPAKDFVAPNALGWLTVQWLREGQIHADRPAPQGGRPQKKTSDWRELLTVLGRPTD